MLPKNSFQQQMHGSKMRNSYLNVTLPKGHTTRPAQVGEFIPELVQLCKQCWLPMCKHDGVLHETRTEAQFRYALQGHDCIRYPDGTIYRLIPPPKVKSNSILNRSRNAD